MTAPAATTPAPVAHPREIDIPVMGGAHTVRIRPWNMAQRARIKPRLAGFLEAATGNLDKTETDLMKMLAGEFEDELFWVAKETVEMPAGVSWEMLDWADGWAIVSAIWTTSILTEDGGGLLGKMVALGVGLGRAAYRADLSRTSSNGKPMPSASPSSPDAGEPPRSASATS